MVVLKMAWKNLWRNKRRSILACIAIVIGTVMLILQMGIFDYVHDKLIKGAIATYVGHIQIHRKGYFKNEHVDSFMIKEKELIDIIKKTPHIKAVSPRIKTPALVANNDNSLGCLLVGIIPDEEKEVTIIQERGIKEGAFLKQENTKGILIGDTLAKSLEVTVGSKVILLLQSYIGTIETSELDVVGIFDLGLPELNRNMVFANLNFVRETLFYKPDAISELAIKIDKYENLDIVLKDIGDNLKNIHSSFFAPLPDIPKDDVAYKPVDEYDEIPREIPIASYLKEGVEVLSWKDLLPGVLQYIKMDEGVTGMIMFILFFVVALIIFNIILMAVFERTREFGIMRAVGMRPNSIIALVLLESLFLSLISVFVGEIIAVAFCGYLMAHPIDLSEYKHALQIGLLDPRISVFITFETLFYPALVASIATIVFSIFPAWKASRMSPVDAIHHN